MDVSRAVDEFVNEGQALFHLLRREGEHLSDLDLHRLRTQLHILEMEISNLQTFRKLKLDNPAA